MKEAATVASESATPECPVCGNNHTFFKYIRNGYPIYRCRSCSVEFVFPQPSDDVLASIYTNSYFLGSSDEAAMQRMAELKSATAALYLDIIRRSLGKTGGELLEIGCGSGDFLVQAQKQGFSVEGVEYSSHAAAVANARLGKQAVLVGSLEIPALAHKSVDVVAAFDVIEHVRSPMQAAQRMHSLLTVGGIVAIVTPSLDSWSRRLLGRQWMEYKPEHLTYFSRASLSRLLEATGFTDVSFFPNYKVLTFDYIHLHFQRFPVPFVSSLVKLLRKLTPAVLAHKHLKIVASGTMAVARKRS